MTTFVEVIEKDADRLIGIRRGDRVRDYLCCSTCRRTPDLARTITASGVSHVYLFCWSCGKKTGTATWNIPHIDLKRSGYSIDKIKIARVNHRPICERCGHIGAELHHWAPQAIFRNSDNWPTGYLCVSCHRDWHKTMNRASKKTAGTAGLTYGQSQR